MFDDTYDEDDDSDEDPTFEDPVNMDRRRFVIKNKLFVAY